MKILVVCAGNTCRSPAGEAAIRAAAARAGIEVDVFSAGTSADHVGAPPTPAMVTAGHARGIDISGTARQVTLDDLEMADAVLAMDHMTKLFLESLGSTASIELFGSEEVRDPYGGDDAVYAATLDRIIAAADTVVATLSD